MTHPTAATPARQFPAGPSNRPSPVGCSTPSGIPLEVNPMGRDVPPYITVKDPAVNRAIRTAYPVCSGTYSLAVPFAVLTFNLAIRGHESKKP